MFLSEKKETSPLILQKQRVKMIGAIESVLEPLSLSLSLPLSLSRISQFRRERVGGRFFFLTTSTARDNLAAGSPSGLSSGAYSSAAAAYTNGHEILISPGLYTLYVHSCLLFARPSMKRV